MPAPSASQHTHSAAAGNANGASNISNISNISNASNASDGNGGARDRDVVVRCDDVHKTYGRGSNATAALTQINLRVSPGEAVALTGPSGSGKSTLLHLLGAMDTACSGKVFVGGQDLSALDDHGASTFRNQRLGFVFQFFHLMSSLSVLDNIALPSRLGGRPADEARGQALQLAERVGVAELVDRSPDTLSGGQRQRVAVARALINRPALVLADEPTGNLDHVAGAEVIELLASLGHERGVAVIVATHDPAVTAASDREIRLVDGRVVGNP